jgi:hypothetical protein
MIALFTSPPETHADIKRTDIPPVAACCKSWLSELVAQHRWLPPPEAIPRRTLRFPAPPLADSDRLLARSRFVAASELPRGFDTDHRQRYLFSKWEHSLMTRADQPGLDFDYSGLDFDFSGVDLNLSGLNFYLSGSDFDLLSCPSHASSEAQQASVPYLSFLCPQLPTLRQFPC